MELLLDEEWLAEIELLDDDEGLVLLELLLVEEVLEELLLEELLCEGDVLDDELLEKLVLLELFDEEDGLVLLDDELELLLELEDDEGIRSQDWLIVELNRLSDNKHRPNFSGGGGIVRCIGPGISNPVHSLS